MEKHSINNSNFEYTLRMRDMNTKNNYPKIICIDCGRDTDNLSECSFCHSKNICYIRTIYYRYLSRSDQLSAYIVYNKTRVISTLAIDSYNHIKKHIPEILDCDLITTCPPYKENYNTMEHIGNHFAKETGKKYVKALVVKTKDVRSNKHDWEKNSLYNENIRVITRYKNSKVLLLEDVITYGNTIKNQIEIFKKYRIETKVFVIAHTKGKKFVF